MTLWSPTSIVYLGRSWVGHSAHDPCVLAGRRGQEPGEFDRFADHRPVARVDADKLKVPGLGEFRHVTGADPVLSLGRGEFGAHEHDRNVEPPLVRQSHHTLGTPSGTGIAAAAMRRLASSSRSAQSGPANGQWLASVPFAFRVDGGQELRAAVATVAARFTAALADQP
jgi:hypothetical protein